jgi:site-specific DNA recombinase
MKVAVYCRVSSDEQRDKQTIDTQTDFATRYTQLHNELEVVEVYKDDGVSGGVPVSDRPEGARMLADAKAHRFDMLIVYRVDRLSRSLLDLLRTTEALEEWHVTLRSMTEPFDTSTPLGTFVLQLLGMLAELEKSNIRDRSVTGSMRCAREGKWLGGLSPLGYKVEGGRLVVEPEEAALVDRIFTLCSEERMTLQEIVDLLNAEDVPVRNERRGKGKMGTRWQKGTVSKILHNTTYLGQNLYNKRKTVRRGGQIVGQELTEDSERIVREAPPIISPEVFARARAFLKENDVSPVNAKREYLLRGLVKCNLCGQSYSGCSPSGRNVFYYKCVRYMTGTRPERCPSAIVRGDQLEAEVWSDIQDFARNPGKVVQKLRAQAKAQKNDMQPLHGERDMIVRDIQAKQSERQRVIGLVRRALISDAEAEQELTSLQREIEALEKRARSLTKRVDQAEELQTKLASADALLQKLAQAVEGATEQKKREIIKLLVQGIQVDTVVENGKKVPHIHVTYAFEQAPERISGVVSGSPLIMLIPASASSEARRAVTSRP